MRISDWSSGVCSSDLPSGPRAGRGAARRHAADRQRAGSPGRTAMSATVKSRRLGVRDIRKGGDPIVCLTAYSAPMARLLDPHVDLLLVGDSLGMVLYGLDSTLSVTLDMMIAHGAAVMRGDRKSTRLNSSH